MIHITEKEIKEAEECDEWKYFGEDGKFHLREDAPQRIKDIDKKMRMKYKKLPN